MLTEWTQSFYSIALDACARAVLLAGLVSIILAALRVRSSGVAHAAWRGVLFAMLFMPALPYCVPSITIPVRVPFRALDRADAVAKAPAVSPVFETSEAVSIAQLPAIRVAATSVATARPSSMWPLALIVYGIGVLVLLSRLLLGRRSMKRIADASLRIGPELLAGAAAV